MLQQAHVRPVGRCLPRPPGVELVVPGELLQQFVAWCFGGLFECPRYGPAGACYRAWHCVCGLFNAQGMQLRLQLVLCVCICCC